MINTNRGIPGTGSFSSGVHFYWFEPVAESKCDNCECHKTEHISMSQSDYKHDV